jgi:all-trans-8'-apo-beta-carotenal 15,15'-oxygenase
MWHFANAYDDGEDLVRDPSLATLGDGHVLALVTDAKAGKSAIHVWDAPHLDEGPAARVHLRHASPQTFHGAFLSRAR